MANANLMRVNIVVDAKKYEHVWRPFAGDNYHNNFSQLARAAIDDLINRFKNSEGVLELRPVLDRLDKLEEQIAEIGDVINSIEERTDTIWSTQEVKSKKLLDDILEVLQQAMRPLFTEDVKEKLPQYTIDEVRTGLEWLADREHAIGQITPPGGGKTTWKYLGC